jgi:hypothetical protein
MIIILLKPEKTCQSAKPGAEREGSPGPRSRDPRLVHPAWQYQNKNLINGRFWPILADFLADRSAIGQ